MKLLTRQREAIVLLAFSAHATVFAFAPPSIITSTNHHAHGAIQSSSLFMTSSPATKSTSSSITEDTWFLQWARDADIVLNSKLSIRESLEEERGKGGVEANTGIQALEVLATIPRSLIVTAVDAPTRAMEAAAQAKNFSWATDLTAATLAALHPLDEHSDNSAIAAWIQQWKTGGWATDSADLGPPEAKFGPAAVTGSLMATGSDNDHNIYAKFRMPCHPVLLRASNGLAFLTNCSEDEGREALTCRGRLYRSMRDALQELVLESAPRDNGSKRERRCWDVADTLSRVLSRATMLELEDKSGNLVEIAAIVPLHERLAHSSEGGNCRLIASGDEIQLVATQDIKEGEAITRDYNAAPRMEQDVSEGPLRLLLQFGLPPSAWE